MANGSFIDSGRVSGITYFSRWKLIDAQSGTHSGVWIDVRGYPRFSVEVDLASTGTVQIMGSNQPTKPADGTDGPQMGSDIVADGLVAIDTPVSWIKAKITANGSTISVYMNAVSL